MLHNTEKYTRLIKTKAQKFGFQGCGISKSGFLEEDAKPLEEFLKKNYHGEMQYMENYFDKRLDTSLLVEGSKSVISLSYNYFPETEISTLDNFKISKYAYGEDYHDIIKGILKEMLVELQEEIGSFDFRVFVDSAPVLERSWLGNRDWVGLEKMLISLPNSRGHFSF